MPPSEAATAAMMRACAEQKAYMVSYGPQICLMTIKLLDYIDVVPGVGLPLEALNHAALELGAFFMILVPMLMAFSLAFWIWLCNYLATYSTFVGSFYDVFKSINNFPDYEQFEVIDMFSAPLMLTIFVYLVGIFFKTLITVMLSRAYGRAFFEFRRSEPRQWTLERITKVVYKKYKEMKHDLEVKHDNSVWKFLKHEVHRAFCGDEASQ